jgi:hypothetical protein
MNIIEISHNKKITKIKWKTKTCKIEKKCELQTWVKLKYVWNYYRLRMYIQSTISYATIIEKCD